ncbi:Glycerophosphoryl diester phosphodiesterase family-domain-containing protein [Powellomyces hirtus]|nr:Glycerophosphoryl diester phosphodiesterase family-domain-containing protein [Powellomyces hirtus]
MKFGRTLAQYSVAEWATQYISYKSLKRLIKQAKRAQQLQSQNPTSSSDPPTADIAKELRNAFVKMVEAEAGKVNAFVLTQRGITERRLKTSRERLERQGAALSYADNEELVETINEIRVYLYLVLRFVEMNKTGFRKILKKFDKVMDVTTGTALWNDVVAKQPFCTDTSMEGMLQLVDALDEKAHYLQQQQETIPGCSFAKPSPDVNYAFPDDVHGALDRDNVVQLKLVLERINCPAPNQELDPDEERSIWTSILFKACQRKALRCIGVLLERPELVRTPLPADINQRTIIHRIAILGAALKSKNGDVAMRTPSIFEKDDPTLLTYVLERVPGDVAESALRVTDFLGRTPLHYAALYGLPRTAQALLRFLPAGPLKGQWLDDDGHSPLFYAVVRGFVDVVLVFLEKWANVDDLGDSIHGSNVDQTRPCPPLISQSSSHQINAGESATSHPYISSFNPLFTTLVDTHSIPGRLTAATPLALACGFGHAAVTRVLLEHGADANCINEDEETPLHISARGGHIDCVKLLLGLAEPRGSWSAARVDAKDKAFGRTPLFLAAMEGHLDCVKALLDAGASVDVVDSGLLNAHEYAVFRAHNAVAELLRPRLPATPLNTISDISSVAQAVVVERAYGHKYLKGESMIRVYLGSTDLRRQSAPVQLDDKRIPAQMAPGTFRLTVSALNATGEPVHFDLPLLETVPEPIVFHATHPEQVSLQFDIHPAYGDPSKKSRLVGRASALLSTVKTSLWQERMPLGGSVQLPIMSAQSLDTIGTILIEFVVVKPFVHGNFKPDGSSRFWRSEKTKVVGHRGLGMNKAAHVADGRGHLQLGENTLLSFITAGALGAEYVEFDVQLTRDLVPVLYHDFRVWETGYNLPMSALTVTEFLALRPKERPSLHNHHQRKTNNGNSSIMSSENGGTNSPGGGTPALLRRTMSMSDARFAFDDATAGGLPTGGPMTPIAESAPANATSVTKTASSMSTPTAPPPTTNPAGSWPTKGNDEGSVQLPFATLEDALKNVPTKIGFNIEVKYPNLEEAEQDDLHNAEINVFCDRVLEVVFDHARDRNIYFSSFHPEICWMLSMKQNHYPVFFLTEGGTEHTSDARANTLHDAVRFAARSGCLGIVTKVDPILDAPGLVRAIRESGLLLFTYGAKNNVVQNVRLQKNWGVDAVIVDKVRSVWREFQGA